MEKKEDLERVHAEKDAETIIARIREESERETAGIVQRARQEAEKIIRNASIEAERGRGELLGGIRQELEKTRERIFSSVNLEKKRLVLEEKSNFIRQVLIAVRALAAGFRERQGYDDFLRRAVAEGARVVGGAELEIVYAAPDEKLFLSGGFIIQLESLSQEVLKKTVTFRYVRGDFDEPGVIVSSPDGRIQFDNRFSSRLSRLENDIYARLLKEF